MFSSFSLSCEMGGDGVVVVFGLRILSFPGATVALVAVALPAVPPTTPQPSHFYNPMRDNFFLARTPCFFGLKTPPPFSSCRSQSTST